MIRGSASSAIQPGTNLEAAWLFRIQGNELIDSVRQSRVSDEIDDLTPGLPHAPRRENGIVMRKLERASLRAIGYHGKGPPSDSNGVSRTTFLSVKPARTIHPIL